MRFLCITLIIILSFSCNNSDVTRTQLIHYAPEKASIIIRTSNIEDLKSSIHNSGFFKNFSNEAIYKNLEGKFENVSLLKPSGDVLICFSNDASDSLQYTIITKHSETLFITDSLKNYKEETLTSKGKTIIKSTLKNHTFYSTFFDGVFMASSSQAIIDAAYNKTTIDSQLEKIFNTTTNDKTASIIIKSDTPFIKSIFIDDRLPLNTFTKYIAVDVDINQNQLLFNGITQSLDSLHVINIFKNTIPQENQLQHITPQTSDGFMSFTFNDFDNLKTNLRTSTEKDSITQVTPLFDNIMEVGVIFEANNRAVVLNSLDIIATKE